MIYVIRDGVKEGCAKLFLKCWTENHYLMGNELYVRKEEDLPKEVLYHEKQLASIVKDLGYIKGGISKDEANRKRLKCLIDT